MNMDSEHTRTIGIALVMLNEGLPQTPGLTPDNIKAYAYVLQGIPLEAIKAAILAILQTWEKPTLLPTPGTIRKTAVAWMADEAGVPTAEQAWGEVMTQLRSRGIAAARFSHPAITDAVEAMGGKGVIATSGNMVADRAHWFGTIYPRIRERHIAHVADEAAMQLAAGKRTPRLAEGGDDG